MDPNSTKYATSGDRNDSEVALTALDNGASLKHLFTFNLRLRFLLSIWKQLLMALEKYRKIIRVGNKIVVVESGEGDGKGNVDVKQQGVGEEVEKSLEDNIFLKLRKQLSKSQVSLIHLLLIRLRHWGSCRTLKRLRRQ